MVPLIEEIEVFLKDECDSVFPKNNWKFYRVNKNNQNSDYTFKSLGNINNVDMYLELFERLLVEKRPLWVNLIKLSVSLERACVFLNRKYFFAYGIKEIFHSGSQYGTNKLYNEMFLVSLDSSFPLNSITSLRGEIVVDILTKLIETSGGKVCEKKENLYNKEVNYKLIASTSNIGNKNGNYFILVGPILIGKDPNKTDNITIDEYYKLRTEEINSMCDHKLEINDVTKNKEDLVRATIFFDLLQSNVHKPITLCLGNQKPDVKTSCKGALFVMYNYVRLVSITGKFENLVSSGKYLPLPPIEEIDFSLLSQDAEWSIMYDYVLNWPLVIKRSFEDFEEGRPKIHNIFRFLINFSSLFSVYYHRTRILTDARPHLMSVLYARIYFLKAIAQVLKNALSLILLCPINKM